METICWTQQAFHKLAARCLVLLRSQPMSVGSGPFGLIFSTATHQKNKICAHLYQFILTWGHFYVILKKQNMLSFQPLNSVLRDSVIISKSTYTLTSVCWYMHDHWFILLKSQRWQKKKLRNVSRTGSSAITFWNDGLNPDVQGVKTKASEVPLKNCCALVISSPTLVQLTEETNRIKILMQAHQRGGEVLNPRCFTTGPPIVSVTASPCGNTHPSFVL